ncbi:MAG: hypothetical protein Kow0029_14040 [Candidatus Rifleibacteriota bacterium]
MTLEPSINVFNTSGLARLNCLLKSDIRLNDRACITGFTLIETLIVVLVIGALCATGVSIYAGATGDSQLRSLKDEIGSFFTACKHRARLRKTPVKLVFEQNVLGIKDSNALRLRIPEISKNSVELIRGLTIFSDRTIDEKGKLVKKLDLQVILPGNRPATITLDF